MLSPIFKSAYANLCRAFIKLNSSPFEVFMSLFKIFWAFGVSSTTLLRSLKNYKKYIEYGKGRLLFIYDKKERIHQVELYI